MTDAAKATPRPWCVHLVDNTMIVGADGTPVAFVQGDYVDDTQWPTMEANAALIVRAVNSHDDLVAAVNEILPMCGDVSGDEETQWTRAVLKLRAALAKARGQ